ncbi:MAG: GDP-mannose 4,6-dehydratase [Planctomycetes bacterium]|nr:GDP-mannose 4,6-dehydratase [Planctomycetota bacterium]MBI5796393.1 GDP-mannose 4,6-dehydratase [Planctomycetota bacterium]
MLVTGATGFIGFHLCKKLIECGSNVLGIDNLSNYYDVNLKINRLKQLTGMENFRFLKIDLSEKKAIEENCSWY